MSQICEIDEIRYPAAQLAHRMYGNEIHRAASVGLLCEKID